MNKKIHWEKISVLVVVLVGVVVILFVMGKKLGYFDNFIASAPSETETFEEKKVVLPVENVYVNERYGFQMTLPKNWKKEKTYTKDVIIGGMDSDYPGIELGYAFDQEVEVWGQIGYLYGIYIIPHDEWKKKVDQSIMVKLGENNEYVFAFLPENDLFRNVGCGDVNVDPFVPQQQQEFCTAYADLKNILNTKAIDKLNFSTADVNVAWDAENTYTDSLVGYSFSYPQEWLQAKKRRARA